MQLSSANTKTTTVIRINRKTCFIR